MSAELIGEGIQDRVLEILDKSKTSLAAHCKTFHPERFDREFSRRHHIFFEAYDDPKVQNLLVVCHRGWGKTSIFNYAVPSQHIIHNLSKYITTISATQTGSLGQSENLRRFLERSDLVKYLHGDVRTKTWGKMEWITSMEQKFLPRTVNQQIRGLLYETSDGAAHRPQLVIGDDLESREGVLNEESRQKTKEWWFADAANCVDRSKGNYRYILTGTILHQAALLVDLMNDPSWTVLNFPLCSDEYKSYWPAFLDDSACKELADDFARQGMYETFGLEYLNDPAPKKDALFKKEYFQHYTPAEEDLDNNPDIETYVIVDPTKSERPTSADSAVVVASFDKFQGKIYFRESYNAKITTDTLYHKAIDLAMQYRARTIAVEVTGLNEFITKPFKDALRERSCTCEFVELKARKGTGEYSARTKGKAGRVASLSYYYKTGKIHHNALTCHELEKQLMAFPRAALWDVMDAFAYIIELTELGKRYLTPKRKVEDSWSEEKRTAWEEQQLDREEEYYQELLADSGEELAYTGPQIRV